MTLTDTIDNYPGFDEGIDGFTLGMKMQAGAEKYGATTEYTEVTTLKLDSEIKEVVTTYSTFLGRTVVIATGANPRTIGLDNEASLIGRGVHYCAHCDGRFYKDKTVVVVGGGNSAVGDALYLSRLCKKVYLVHRRDSFRASKVYDAPLRASENIEFVLDSVVSELVADARLTSVVTENVKSGEKRTIDCDGIFVSIGRKPATEFLGDTLDLDKAGYIIAGESCETRVPGVYAIGDVRTKELRQVVTATADGAIAAHKAEEFISRGE